MRKSYIATWILIACSVLATFVIAIQIYGTRDDVVLTETVVYGDPSRADGLTLEIFTRLNNLNNEHYWHTNYTLGDPDISQTDTFHEYNKIPPELIAHEDTYAGFNIGKRDSFVEPYAEIFENSADGYYENKYYRLFVEFDLPCLTNYYLNRIFDSQHERDILNQQKSILQNYFKIPRINAGDDSYYWTSVSTYSDDMCYFTFDLHSKKGNIVDTSLLPDGFGIFAFPYEKGYIDENGDHILGTDTSKLEMIYALDPNTYIDDLHLDSTQKHLLLFTIENNFYVLHAIDLETKTEIKKLELPISFENRDRDIFVLVIDGGILIYDFDLDQVNVISSGTVHSYNLDFTFSFENDFISVTQLNQPMCYDGNRLAFMDFSSNNTNDFGAFSSIDINIAIFDETGLSYYGSYRNSLFSGIEMGDSVPYTCDYFLIAPKFSW